MMLSNVARSDISVCSEAEVFMEIIHFLQYLCAVAGKQWDFVKASLFAL